MIAGIRSHGISIHLTGSNGNGEEGGKKEATQAKYIRQGDVMKAEAQRRALEQAKRDKEREDARRQRIEVR
jgi:hypothetical protein